MGHPIELLVALELSFWDKQIVPERHIAVNEAPVLLKTKVFSLTLHQVLSVDR